MTSFNNTLDASRWDAAVACSPDGGLLQSRAWAQFQERLGRRVEFISVQLRTNNLHTLVVEHRLPLGLSYVYSPRGPVAVEPIANSQWPIVLVQLIQAVREKFPHAIFWRIEPPVSPTYNVQLTTYNLIRAPRDVQPSTTLVIDLTKSEDELLAAMKEKTRYNIRLAERHGVTVRVIEAKPQSEEVEQFFELLRETAKRDGFRAHTRRHYELLLATRSLDPTRDDDIVLVIAEHSGRMMASAIVAFFGSWCYYLHGASSSERREVMAPYALHWEIMRGAKRRGCTHYDLWGIASQLTTDNLQHTTSKLAGVTRFKTGFAPNTAPTSFVGTWEVVLRPVLYRLYRAAVRLSF